MSKATLVRVGGVIVGVTCIFLSIILVMALRGEERSTGFETVAAGTMAAVPVSPLLPMPSEVAPTSVPQPVENEPIQYYPVIPGMTPVPITPPTVLPPTPFPEATTFRDPGGLVTLTFPKGWYSSSAGSLLEGETVVSNYDGWDQENLPANLISVHMGVTELESGQTLEQLIAARIQDAQFPKHGSGADLIVEPQPIQLAGYSGLTYTFSEQNKLVPGGVRVVQEVFLHVGDRYVFGTVIDPTTSPEYKIALAILESLKVANNLGQ